MKIIITESQYKFLKKTILIESSDDVSTYVTKKNRRLYAKSRIGINTPWNWQDLPAGTKFKYNPVWKTMDAWNQKFVFSCNDSTFYNFNKKITYNGDDVLAPTLKKFCNNKKNLEKTKLSSDSISTYSKTQDSKCIATIKGPYQKAITWWKNKLNEPSFYKKLKRLNKYTDAQTKEWIKKYKDYLYNNVKGPFCPKQNSDIYKKHFSRGGVRISFKNGKQIETQIPEGLTPNAIAFSLLTNEGNLIVVNNFYPVDDSKDLEATFVHELQHALYDLKPMTPNESWKKVFPYKVWVDDPNDNTNTPTPISNKESSTISKYGLRKYDIDFWKEILKTKTNKKTQKDVGYVCRETELASRLVTMKNLLNYSTSQKITVNDFKKFIEGEESPYNDENAYWLVLCWVNNGMEDIQTFLNKLDKYVVAKVEPNKDDLDMGNNYT